MKALITGGCGFIGSNLTHELVRIGWDVDIIDDLSNGHLEFLKNLDVRIIPVAAIPLYQIQHESHDDKQVRVFTGDFVHENILKRISTGKYDVVFHMAANPRVEFSVKNPVYTTEINVYKTVALFKSCASGKSRVVFSSSSAVYGDAKTLPTSEIEEKNPESPYGLQKLVAEQFATLFCKLYNSDIISLRYFNVYGPRQLGGSAYSTAVSAWCNAIFKNKHLRSDGDGTQTRDMIYVGDIVSANIKAAMSKEKFSGQTLNIATGTQISNNQILEIFKEQYNNLEVTTAPWRPGDVMHTLANISHAKSLLGFNANVAFSEGLEETLRWWKEWSIEGYDG